MVIGAFRNFASSPKKNNNNTNNKYIDKTYLIGVPTDPHT
jgi:hypothetical protein